MSVDQPLLIAAVVEKQTFHTHTRRRDLGAFLPASLWENLGARQATAWWRLEGWWASLRGREQTWGTMTEASAGD